MSVMIYVSVSFEVMVDLNVYSNQTRYLSARSTCRHRHSLTHDEAFWEFQVRKLFSLFFTTNLSSLSEAMTRSSHYPLEGVAYDPSVQGNREILVIYSPEFRKIMIEKNGKAKQDPFRHAMLETVSRTCCPACWHSTCPSLWRSRAVQGWCCLVWALSLPTPS